MYIRRREEKLYNMDLEKNGKRTTGILQIYNKNKEIIRRIFEMGTKRKIEEGDLEEPGYNK